MPRVQLSVIFFGSSSLPVHTGILSVMLSATALSGSERRILACSLLRAWTSYITNGRCVIHFNKSGLMSLQSSQHAGTKNKAGSQLSVVVSMMGMRWWVPTSMWFLGYCSPVDMQGREDGCKKLLRTFSGIGSAAHPLWRACHLFSYHTFSSWSCPERAAYYAWDREGTLPN